MTQRTDGASHQPGQEQLSQLIALFSSGQHDLLHKQATVLLQRFPDSPIVLNLLAAASLKLGDRKAAYGHFEQAITIAPGYAQAYNNYGVALLEDDHSREALDKFARAVEIKPDFDDAWSNLSAAQLRDGAFEAAISAARKALALSPENASAHNNLGAALRDAGQTEEAVTAFSKALDSQPDFADAHNNLGSMHLDLGQIHAAKGHLDRAIACDPQHLTAMINLAQAHRETGDLDTALACYHRALEIDPQAADAHFGRGVMHLKSRDFVRAWPELEFRWQRDETGKSPLSTTRPLWDGGRVGTLFVWKEQGIGDEIMFNSCLLEIADHCDRLIVSASKRLIPLFERSFDASITFVDATHPPDESSYDVQAPALTALGHLRKTLDDFAKAARPYLKPDPDLVEKTTDRLRKLAGGKKTIGLSWRTSNAFSSARRNLDLERLVSALPQNACLVNLQYGAVKADIDALEERTGRVVHIMDEIDIFYDLDGFAALISACDEIVSIDNSTVHFAGSIGTNCHVLLPFNADWRWGPHEATHSYWYEHMKLHWQEKSHDWEAALVALRRSL